MPAVLHFSFPLRLEVLPRALLLGALAIGGALGAGGCNSDMNLTGDGDAAVAAVPTPDLSHGGVTVAPGIISRAPQSAVESETHVMAAPNGFVCVAYISVAASGASTNGYVFSTDDGTTFLAPDQIGSPRPEVSSDPVLATDAQSNFYMTWIGYRQSAMGNPTDMHVYMSVAPAGTTKFTTPVVVNEATGDQYDKPWITVTNDNAVLVTYARTSTGGILAARSTDRKTFTNSVIVEDRNFRNLVFPCHPSTGNRVYAVYNAGGGVGLRWSDDSGVTWPDANKNAAADPQNEGGPPAFDGPFCAAEGDEVWVVYGLTADQGGGTTQSANLNALRIAHSADGGKTIDRRTNAEDSQAASYYLHPYLVREGNGTLDLTYYAGNSDGDTHGSFRRATSSDGGNTWAASTAIHSPITFLGARDSQKWLGDYSGLWWTRNNLYASYVDNSGLNAHVAFFRTASPPAP